MTHKDRLVVRIVICLFACCYLVTIPQSWGGSTGSRLPHLDDVVPDPGVYGAGERHLDVLLRLQDKDGCHFEACSDNVPVVYADAGPVGLRNGARVTVDGVWAYGYGCVADPWESGGGTVSVVSDPTDGRFGDEPLVRVAVSAGGSVYTGWMAMADVCYVDAGADAGFAEDFVRTVTFGLYAVLLLRMVLDAATLVLFRKMADGDVVGFDLPGIGYAWTLAAVVVLIAAACAFGGQVAELVFGHASGAHTACESLLAVGR